MLTKQKIIPFDQDRSKLINPILRSHLSEDDKDGNRVYFRTDLRCNDNYTLLYPYLSFPFFNSEMSNIVKLLCAVIQVLKTLVPTLKYGFKFKKYSCICLGPTNLPGNKCIYLGGFYVILFCILVYLITILTFYSRERGYMVISSIKKLRKAFFPPLVIWEITSWGKMDS